MISALPLCEAIGNNDALAVISENIGEIYVTLGQPEMAMPYLERSIQALGDAPNSSVAYNSIGKIHLSKGKYDQALIYHNKALDIAQKKNSPRHIE
jgi:tetratricopeptide (TPR) repeat protein